MSRNPLQAYWPHLQPVQPGRLFHPQWCDQHLVLRWQEHHQREAVLRVLSAAEHARVPKVRVDWCPLL